MMWEFDLVIKQRVEMAKNSMLTFHDNANHTTNSSENKSKAKRPDQSCREKLFVTMTKVLTCMLCHPMAILLLDPCCVQ